ncbi:MAG: DNA-directed RNA polymerase subunit L [Candidatus Bathyarchaeota archaeon]|nr:MAG: DNA-directed RNA polymerase subunit L [Candidatus Bathyarchaeota archaeon]
MKIVILNKTKNELKVRIDGEGHTFCNVVQKALLKDKRVELAGYDIPHPLTSSPIIYLRTKERSNPVKTLRDATRDVLKDTDAFKAALKKALKEWKSTA